MLLPSSEETEAQRMKAGPKASSHWQLSHQGPSLLTPSS
jgi:hypothetical protein